MHLLNCLACIVLLVLFQILTHRHWIEIRKSWMADSVWLDRRQNDDRLVDRFTMVTDPHIKRLMGEVLPSLATGEPALVRVDIEDFQGPRGRWIALHDSKLPSWHHERDQQRWEDPEALLQTAVLWPMEALVDVIDNGLPRDLREGDDRHLGLDSLLDWMSGRSEEVQKRWDDDGIRLVGGRRKAKRAATIVLLRLCRFQWRAIAEVTEPISDSKAEERVSKLKAGRSDLGKAPRELRSMARRLSAVLPATQRRPILPPATVAHRRRRLEWGSND